MNVYVEYRLTKQGETHKAQWEEFATHEAKSRRACMKQLNAADKAAELGNVQRKVRKV